MLVDQYGKELKARRPITDEVAVSSVRDRYQSYPSHGLTPDALAVILKEADQGDVYRQSELFEEMEEKDTHLGSTLQTRKLAVSGLSWEVISASNSAEDKKIAAAAKEMIEYIENWEDALLDILDAIGKGFSVNEIMWQIAEGRVWIKSLKWLHQKRFTFSGPPTQIGKYTTSPLLEAPRLITDDQQVYGEELLPMKFVFHRHKARSGATARGGLCRPCSYMYLFKNYDVKDWLIFNELYSVPMRLGKYKPGATPDEISKLKMAVFNLGVDAAAVVSDSTVIELLESKVRGETSAFKDLADFCDKAMSKAVLGHTGSSESTPGKLGSEDAANDVRQDLLESDARAVEKTVKFQILQPWVIYNFGSGKGVPKFKLHCEAQEDIEKTARAYGVLVKDVNFKGIGVNHIRERFGIPEPEPNEETVSAVQAVKPSAPSQQDTSYGVHKTHMPKACSCRHDHALMINAAQDVEWVAEYLRRLEPMFQGLTQIALDRIERWLLSLDLPPTAEEFIAAIREILGGAYSDIDDLAVRAQVEAVYAAFRFSGIAEAIFGGPDMRTIDFLAKLDRYYLSKFLSNPDAESALYRFLLERYHEGGAGLFGRDPGSIAELKNLLAQKLTDLTDAQVQRIVDTAVQRARNWGSISQMYEFGIAEVEVFEPTQDCEFCKAIHGKVISVDTAYAQMQEQAAMIPEEFEAFLKDRQATLDNIQDFVDDGLLPPYHPHCHGRIIKRVKGKK